MLPFERLHRSDSPRSCKSHRLQRGAKNEREREREVKGFSLFSYFLN
ncbi:hypothetical protein HP9810_10g1 [Helicobacter pylori 98-10]|nr:hypothetical protein HP9810_10g1 [Helicobacter pylori 98-10]